MAVTETHIARYCRSLTAFSSRTVADITRSNYDDLVEQWRGEPVIV